MEYIFKTLIFCTFVFIVLTSIITWIYFSKNGVLNKSLVIKEDTIIPFKAKKYQNYTFTSFNATSPYTITLMGGEDDEVLNFDGTINFGYTNDAAWIAELNPRIPNVYPSINTPLFPVNVAANETFHIVIFVNKGIISIRSVVVQSFNPFKETKLY